MGAIRSALESAYSEREYGARTRESLRQIKRQAESDRIAAEEREYLEGERTRARAMYDMSFLTNETETDDWQIKATPEMRADYLNRINGYRQTANLPPLTEIPDRVENIFWREIARVQTLRHLTPEMRRALIRDKFGDRLNPILEKYRQYFDLTGIPADPQPPQPIMTQSAPAAIPGREPQAAIGMNLPQKGPTGIPYLNETIEGVEAATGTAVARPSETAGGKAPGPIDERQPQVSEAEPYKPGETVTARPAGQEPKAGEATAQAPTKVLTYDEILDRMIGPQEILSEIGQRNMDLVSDPKYAWAFLNEYGAAWVRDIMPGYGLKDTGDPATNVLLLRRTIKDMQYQQDYPTNLAGVKGLLGSVQQLMAGLDLTSEEVLPLVEGLPEFKAFAGTPLAGMISRAVAGINIYAQQLTQNQWNDVTGTLGGLMTDKWRGLYAALMKMRMYESVQRTDIPAYNLIREMVADTLVIPTSEVNSHLNLQQYGISSDDIYGPVEQGLTPYQAISAQQRQQEINLRAADLEYKWAGGGDATSPGSPGAPGSPGGGMTLAQIRKDKSVSADQYQALLQLGFTDNMPWETVNSIVSTAIRDGELAYNTDEKKYVSLAGDDENAKYEHTPPKYKLKIDALTGGKTYGTAGIHPYNPRTIPPASWVGKNGQVVGGPFRDADRPINQQIYDTLMIWRNDWKTAAELQIRGGKFDPAKLKAWPTWREEAITRILQEEYKGRVKSAGKKAQPVKWSREAVGQWWDWFMAHVITKDGAELEKMKANAKKGK